MASTRFGPGGRKEEDGVLHPVLKEALWDNPFLQGLERHAPMHLADQGGQKRQIEHRAERRKQHQGLTHWG